MKARYGYIGAGFYDASQYGASFEQAAHDVSVEANRFAEDFLAGDHELRFGFEYKTSSLSDFFPSDPAYAFSYYDNNAPPGDPLTEGSITVYYPEVPKRSKITRTSLYAGDTFRRGRLTLNLGLRFDRQTGKNEPRSYSSPLDVFARPDFLGPGFEDLILPVEYPGKDPGVSYDNLSPRIGATYGLTGNGRIQAYGSFARYYQPYERSVLLFSELFDAGFFATYRNGNGDRVITPDEIVDSGSNNFKEDLSRGLYDKDLSNGFVNEYVIGVQTQLRDEWSLSAAVTHRSYHDFHIRISFGLTTDYFQFIGTRELHTPLGDFIVPFVSLSGFNNNGTILLRNNHGWTQTYDSFELMLEKAMAKNLLVSSGLVFQRQRGHGYSKDFIPFFPSAGAYEAIDPTVNNSVLENQTYLWSGLDKGVVRGSEWQLKLSGAYQFPWHFGLGAFLRYQQGFLFGLFAFTTDTSGITAGRPPFFFVEPFGKRRHGNIFTLDLRFDKEFHLKDYGRADLILEIFNVTNANTVIARDIFVGFYSFHESVFVEPNSELNRILQFLSPRVFRLGLRYSF